MAERTVRVMLVGDASSLIAAAQRAREALNQLGNTDTSRVGAGFRDSSRAAGEMGTTTESTFSKLKSSMAATIGAGALMSMGVMSAFFAIKEAITSTVAAGVDYQTTLFTLQAVTHATGEEMVAVAQKSRDLGKDMTIPGASATDAAKAMTELAKGSLSVADAMTAAKGTLQLAAAAGVDASRAAEIQVNTLNAYHLAADQAGHVADVLANAANQASGEMTDFAYGLVKVEATAHGFNIGLEDTTTVLGLFANAGIKGAEGGTTLNTMLTHLAAPTKPGAEAIKTLGLTVFDAAGQFEGLKAVVDQLRGAHEKLTPAVYDNAASIAFGTRGIRGAMILGAEAGDAYDKMSTALTHEGGAAELAGAKMQGLGGAFQNLENQVQDAQLAVFDNIAPGLTAMVNAFAGSVPVLIDAALGGIAVIGSKVGELLSPVVEGIKRLFASANTSDALHMLGTDLMAVGGAAVSALGALQPLTNLIGNAVGWFADLPAPIQAVAFALGAMVLLQGPVAGLILSIKTGFQIVGYEAGAMSGRVAAAGGVMALSMDAVGTAAKGMWTAMGGWVGVGIAAVVGLFSLFSGGADTATVAVTDLSDAVDTNTGKLKDNATQILATLLANDGSLQTYNSIGGVVGDYTAALTGNVTAQEAVHAQLLDSATAAVEASSGWQQNQVAMENSGKTARSTASEILAGADASWLGSDAATGQALSIGAVITASNNYAAESDNLAAKQATATLAIQAAGTAAGGAAGAVTSAAGATQQLGNDAANAIDPVTLMDTGLKELKAAASAADTASQFLRLTLIQMSGDAVTTEAATRASEAAFRAIADAAQTVTDKQTALTDAVNKYSADSPQAAAATRDLDAATAGLRDSQDKAGVSATDMASAAYSAKAANGDLQGAVVAASAVMQDQRDKFIAAAEAAGATADEAQALADKEGLIPAHVTTVFNAENLATQAAEVDALNQKLTILNGRTLTYTLVGNVIYQDLASSVPASALAAIHAEGGFVSGPGGPKTDSINARLSAGEFVVNAAQTEKYRGLLEDINNSAAGFYMGGIVGYATGGAVTAATATATDPTAATPDPAPSMLPDAGAIAAAWADIAAAITTAWNTLILPTFDLLDARTLQVGAEFAALDTTQTTPAWADIAATITTTWGATVAPTYAALNAGTQDVGAQWSWLATNTNATAWDQIGAKVWTTWAGTVAPTYGAINNGTQDVGNQWTTLAYNTNATAWGQIGATITGTWGGTVAPTYGAINAGSDNVGATWQNLANTTADTWGRIGGTITATYNNQIVPAWNGVQGFANATGAFFGGIAAGMNTADTTTTTDLSQIQAAIDNFFAMVDTKAPVPALADGGIITQGTGPRTDDVMIRASKGEYVVNAAATARHKPELDAINYGGYADGGMIGDKIGNRVENAVVGGVERAFNAGVTRILASVAATISGYTPGSVAGTRGKFLDAVASKMGSSYVWGAAGPDVFDCSGLMSWGLEQAGAGVGRLTAQQFNDGFAHIAVSSVVPGDLVTFDTGRIPGEAGHIGAVFDVSRHLMMQTDGSGPAAPADYQNRDGGPLSFIDPIGGTYQPTAAAAGKPGDPPSVGWLADILKRIAAGGTGAAAASATPSTGPVGAGVEQWRSTGLAALAAAGQPASWIGDLLTQMQHESGGDPIIGNYTDVNAQAGDPSIGLMQVIKSTFISALSRHGFDVYIPKGQTDPFSNILASILYTVDQYGDLGAWARGAGGHGAFGAYATGGIVGPDGKKTTDTVPAWLSPGEAVISQMQGTEKANKGYLDTAASWFGGNVTYPGDMKGLPPVGFGSPAVNVAAPVIELYLYGDSSALDGRIDVRVDGALSDVAVKVTRARVST